MPAKLEQNKGPDATEFDGKGSLLVVTVTLLPNVGTEPMVMPVIVTVTAVLAASAEPPVVMTMEVAPGCAGVRVALPVESVAVGVAVVAKKPDG